MAVDVFLKLDGIKGESKQKGHEGEIDVLSWSWGAHQQGTAATGGGMGAGKVSFNDFNFQMEMNTATAQLIEVCSTGKHIPTGFLTARKAGGKQEEYLKLKFCDLLVSSYSTGGHGGGGMPNESISLNFSKVEYKYFEQDKAGTVKNTGNFNYDLKAGVKY